MWAKPGKHVYSFAEESVDVEMVPASVEPVGAHEKAAENAKKRGDAYEARRENEVYGYSGYIGWSDAGG